MKKKSIIELNKLLKLKMSDLKDNIKDDRMPRSHLNLRLLLGETADYKRFNAKKKQKVPPGQKKGLVPPHPPAGHLERTHVQTTAKPADKSSPEPRRPPAAAWTARRVAWVACNSGWRR